MPSRQQQSFFKTHHLHRYCHGGVLRNRRKGRGHRPLACKESLHVVFKVHRSRLRSGFRSPKSFQMVRDIIGQYSRRFFIKIESMSIQQDHIHLHIRTTRRSHFHYFFRVVAGQIAQRFQEEGMLAVLTAKQVTDTPSRGLRAKKDPLKGTGLWKYRPFSRVVKGWRAFKIVKNYIQLNEQETRGKIKYQKHRLRGLSSADWRLLWS